MSAAARSYFWVICRTAPRRARRVRAACWHVAVVSALLAHPARSASGAGVFEERAELFARYQAQLDELARWCDEQKLDTEREQTLAQLPPERPREIVLYALPQATASGLKLDPRWQGKFDALREAQAAAAFELGRRAIRQGHASLAYELVVAAAHANPDHEAARKLLGYVRYRDEWRTPFEVRKLRAGQVQSERFGWLPKNHLPRYESGERWTGNRWLPEADERALHADIERGWQVETEHYRITTNQSLEAGVALGRKLEELHQVWQQVFARYYATAEQLAKLFEGRGSQRADGPRHEVVYFRTREEYNRALQHTIVADIRITTGLYLNNVRRAYFFASEDQSDWSSLYHEATHQLFSESREVVNVPGEEANFWLVEGVACYFESLRREGDRWLLGGPEAVRFRDAQIRLTGTAKLPPFFVPFAEFTRLGAPGFQSHPQIARLYSQAAGLTHFLMHEDQGRFRDALVELLVAIYTGRQRPELIAELSGMPFAELESRYYRFMTGAAPPDDWPRPVAETDRDKDTF